MGWGRYDSKNPLLFPKFLLKASVTARKTSEGTYYKTKFEQSGSGSCQGDSGNIFLTNVV